VVKRYLTVTSLNETLSLLYTGFTCTPSRERVPLLKSVGRVTAEPIFARYSVPEVHLAAMDGIAVISKESKRAAPGHAGTVSEGEHR
jgi:putative molybdopterin biosynthesis protein